METRARYVLMGLFTLVVIAAGFAFVYWMNSAGALGARTAYRLQFAEPVPGLLRGSIVLFNGIKVGEVTGLTIDPANPKGVLVAIAVQPETPVRQDTSVQLSFQGLTGSAAIALKGGEAEAPLLTSDDGRPPILRAPEGSGQDVMTAARIALQRFDGILEENSEGLKKTIDNVKVFSDALARNSDKLDGIVDGLSKLAGAGADKTPVTTYELTPPKDFKTLEHPDGALAVATPKTIVGLDTQKVLIRSGNGRTARYEPAAWADSIPLLTQARIIQTFENAGYAKVGRGEDSLAAGATMAADVTLQYEIREFSVELQPGMIGTVDFSAKLIGEGGEVLGAKAFRATAPVAGDAVVAATDALNAAFGKAAKEMIEWSLETLNQPRP